MTQATLQRIDYLRWSLARVAGADAACPACGSTVTQLVGRKFLVTSLHECAACRLRFRVPKEEPGTAGDFYQDAYHEGMTTEMPDDEELASLCACHFQTTEKDFATYIDVLSAAGVKKGARLLDFGCSWGYGSWQFREAGFDVYSAEISRPRREYARTKLNCRVIDDFDGLKGTIDCFFSAHVIEHLPDPNFLFKLADSVLAPDGVVATFCPNGDPGSIWSGHYSDLWGRKHPLVITPLFMEENSHKFGLRACIFSNPYDLQTIATGHTGASYAGDELCVLMTRERG